MAKDRARDDRRSVGSHEKMMSALKPKGTISSEGTTKGESRERVHGSSFVYPIKSSVEGVDGERVSKKRYSTPVVPGKGHVEVKGGAGYTDEDYEPHFRGSEGIAPRDVNK